MRELIQYLMDNYYAQYRGTRDDVIPTAEQLEAAINNHPDKIIVVRDHIGIKGMSVYLTLSDETYEHLQDTDITQVDVVKELLKERGDNIHFVLLAAGDFRTIINGLKSVIRSRKPKTASWFSPDFKKLHKYRVRK